MNELLAAAKAVIDRWDLSKMYVESPIMDELRAAVDRAEKQEVVGFEEWWKSQHIQDYPWGERKISSMKAWTAAQQAERERFKEIIGELLDPKDPWIHYSTLLEKIDAREDS